MNPPGFVTWGQDSSGTSPSWRSSPLTSDMRQLRQMWSLMRSPGCLLCPPPPLLKSQPSPHRFGPTSQYSQPSATTPTHQVAAGRCRRALAAEQGDCPDIRSMQASPSLCISTGSFRPLLPAVFRTAAICTLHEIHHPGLRATVSHRTDCDLLN